jgi:FtsH-binding integral membrane protein
MNPVETSQAGRAGAVSDAADRVTAFLRVVYGWMAVGLTLTAVVAWMVAGSDTLIYTIATNRLLYWGIFAAQLGVVIFLSARVHKLAPVTAGALFLGYSALTGLTMAFVLRVYTGESVATTFFVTAGTFGALALYGTVTSRSLAGMGQFLFMGLVGIVIASVVGIFWQSDGLQFVIAFCGVILFTLLTAYDAQQLKAIALSVPAGQAGSFAIVGALRLYLDFINLFLYLLRFLGGRRD